MVKGKNLKIKDDAEDEPMDVEETANENVDDFDLAASDTSSDADPEETQSAAEINVYNEPALEKLVKKYRDLHGKQLFIRFPYKLPEDDGELNKTIESLSPLVTNIHRPRQRHARFCLVDFKSKTDRDAALKSIKKIINKNETMKKFVVKIPRTENEEFIKEILERKQKSLEHKRAKARIKRQQQSALHSKTFTSSIVITNLPATATVSQIRELFPDAVDIRIKRTKNKSVETTLATVNLPTTMDASKATKKKLSLGETELNIKICKNIKKKKSKTKKQLENKETNLIAPLSKFSKVLE